MMREKRSGKGFTFVEVIIALAVLVFGLYGVLDLFFTAQGLEQRAGLRTQSLFLAKGKLAELQAAGAKNLFDHFKSTGGKVDNKPIPFTDNPEFEWTWKLNQEGLSSDALRLEVSVMRQYRTDSMVKLTAYVFAGEE